MSATIHELDMTIIGHYADLTPRYRFSTSFPSTGVRLAGPVRSSAEAAYQEGAQILDTYRARDTMGNMGEVCGVARVEGGFRAVINTYHSNT